MEVEDTSTEVEEVQVVLGCPTLDLDRVRELRGSLHRDQVGLGRYPWMVYTPT
jgi:hypothetical protein